MGRFLTPDWSATPVPIPYAVMGNPQTLNLYSYVENNPITGTDPDGHSDGGSLNGGGGAACSGNTNCSDAPSDRKDAERDRQADEAAPVVNSFVAQSNATNAANGGVGTGGASKDRPQGAEKFAWSSLSSAQQGLVPGGQKAWDGLSATQQVNYAAITHGMEGVKLSDGTTGLSQIKTVTEIGPTGIAVTWNAGAKEAFKNSGFDWRPGWGHPGENGVTMGGSTTGLHLLFGDKNPGVGHVHIDYRGLTEGHYSPFNSDVRATNPGGLFTKHTINNYERYKGWYGAIPGYNP